MVDLTIGEVARLASVRTSTLRYYEDAGVLPKARRVNGRRVYGEDLVNLVQVARFAQSVGFSLAQIKALFSGMSGPHDLRKQWTPLAHAKIAELDRAIASATRMKKAIESGLECGCIRLEDCMPGNGRRVV
jgi:MerR family transcriptional regulator, redox-sensitive transcriptional activator SoxR